LLDRRATQVRYWWVISLSIKSVRLAALLLPLFLLGCARWSRSYPSQPGTVARRLENAGSSYQQSEVEPTYRESMPNESLREDRSLHRQE
jgi:hypothetical protein